MQTSLPSRCEGRWLRPGVCVDQRLSPVIRPVSVVRGTDFDAGAAYTLPMKRMSSKSNPPYFHSTLKPSLGIEKYYGETGKRASPLIVNATRSRDKEGEGIPDQSNSGGSDNVLSVFAGVICKLIQGVLDFLSLQVKSFGKFEDKFENAVDVVEEVVDTVKQVANFSEDIAEKVEQHSKDGDILHETAEFVDNISEKAAKEAEIVQNDAEQIKKNLQSLGTDMEAVETSVEDIGDRLSKPIANGDEGPIQTRNSLDPQVVPKNDQSAL